jgi:SSS family solute:Na+ symporter
MIAHLLPAGFRGLVVAALLSALMSTVAGALNSIATVFCYDIYRELRPDATDRQMVRAGRTITFVAMSAAMVWAHKIENFGSILAGNTAMISYLAPSITAVFVGGVFWKGASKAGALATLAGGGLLGLAVFLLDWNKDVTGWNVPALLSSFYLFVVSVCILAVASRVWPVGNEQNTQHLVWSSPWEALRSPGWKGVGNYKFLAATLLLVVVGVYIAFR